ncbi:FGF [Operophtera brumata nucleopolyhedrovirus]|uniref:FGF n=1 Tax=Operophtera brumata nucleopolyhedrovirus TaxID=1046267 RepID=A0A2H4UZW9_9ABAC|nr:FGF [Operophtera brumata nucleopolyhedrovirus]AUA60352.1 FGF [Operophtera brumata nucleopolyhedrovirus]
MNGLIVLYCCVAIIVAYPSLSTINNIDSTELPLINRTFRHIVHSPIASTGNLVKLFIRNRYLQITDDGTINGTNNANSDNIVFKRFIPIKFNSRAATEDKVLVRNMKTCKYVCLSSCGLMYSVDFPNDDCLLSETMTPGSGYSYMHKNRNSSVIHYVALDKHGKARVLTQLKTAIAAKMLIMSTNDDTRDECAPQIELNNLSHLNVPKPVACEKMHRGNIKKISRKNFYEFADDVPTIFTLDDKKSSEESASDEEEESKEDKEHSAKEETLISHTSTFTKTTKYTQCKALRK